MRISLPEEIYGDEAVVLNRRSAIARQARVERDIAWKRILRDLSAKLVDGRLVAYGSLDSSLNQSQGARETPSVQSLTDARLPRVGQAKLMHS
jgi:hypothetical protein